MITYNHGQFISDAIEGVLMQQTSFDYELVVGEDCSTDNTRAILLDYKKKYPNKIRLLLPEKQLGMMSNFTTTLDACTGDYIALCEGDDYWIDSLKLQKQVDFLESHYEYVLSFHNAFLVNGKEGKQPTKTFFDYKKDDFMIEDLFKSWLIPTASVVFRRSALQTFPDWYLRAPVGDTPLFMILASSGRLKLLESVMSVYRNHPGGVTKSINYDFWDKLAVMYDDIDKFFKMRFHKLVLQRKATIYNNLAHQALMNMDFDHMRRAVKELVKLNFRTKCFTREYISITIISFFPMLYLRYKGK
ncbi:glycosyltransferase [Rufibacter immobilis]|uniref:glycosyltransferase n=1 Tax=Rufibacter immobilis TaxID=1348778 RepID=UPI0035E90F5D